MNEPIALIDSYFVSQDRIVLTEPQLQIPGLAMFGRHTIKSAISPLKTHYHPHCFEVTFVLKGAVTFSVENTDYRLKGGDVFITFPDEIHSTNLNPVSICELIWFQIDCTVTNHFLFLDRDTSKRLIMQMHNLNSRTLSMPSGLLQLAENAFQNAYQSHNPQLTAACLNLILQLLTGSSSDSKLQLTNDIQMSLNYISQNLNEQISLVMLADMCRLSVSAFKQKFKHQMGITPRNYINMQKIEQAKQLLDSGCSITDTAMQLGFNTSNYFSTVFKKYAFESPSDYIHNKKHEP